jgi:peptidoglycan LD-endopeptidase CwlK
MPTANFTRINLDLLMPEFLTELLDVIAALNAQGMTYIATMGTRTNQQQAALYAQGRTAPGNIVTNAPPGSSAHNYGLAVDFTRFNGAAPSWVLADYDALGAEVAKHSALTWGGTFLHLPDRPHVQLAGWVTGAELLPLMPMAEDLGAVWDFVRSHPAVAPLAIH